MSYNEYNNLFIKAQQDGGKYRLFTFDIENSKEMNKYDRYISQYEITFLIERIYADIKELEKALNRKILINEKGFGNFFDTSINNDSSYRFEPIIFGDMVGLTIYNESIEPCIINEIFDMNKKELNLNYNFHKNNIVYQTHDYRLANSLYFRGYAIQLCQELHKDKNKKLLEYLKNEDIDYELLNKYMKIVKSNHCNAVNNAINLLSTYTESFLAGIVDSNGNYTFKDKEIKKEYEKRLKK